MTLRTMALAVCVSACNPLAAHAQDEPRERLIVGASYTGELWRQAAGGVAAGSRYLDDSTLR